MELGTFSVSLAVKDLAASRAFYEKLGFTAPHGACDGQPYVILRNGDTILGLFEGMFEKNILTFNPRWDRDAQECPGPDIRELRDQLVAAGLTPTQDSTQETSEGPASFVLEDPDGNPVLVDQHC